jgi:hypothetical protein
MHDTYKYEDAAYLYNTEFKDNKKNYLAVKTILCIYMKLWATVLVRYISE